MRTYNGTDINVIYPETIVYAREKNFITITRKSGSTLSVTVMGVIYYFYEATLKIDLTDIFRSDVGGYPTVTVSTTNDNLTFYFTSMDGFTPIVDSIFPSSFLIPTGESVEGHFYVNSGGALYGQSKLNGVWYLEMNIYAKTPLVYTFSDSTYSQFRVDADGQQTFIKPINICGKYVKLTWLSEFGTQKTLYFYVEGGEANFSETITIPTDDSSWNVIKDRKSYINLIIPKAEPDVFKYVSDVIFSNDVRINNAKVFVENSNFSFFESPLLPKSDLRLKINLRDYEI